MIFSFDDDIVDIEFYFRLDINKRRRFF